MQHRQQHSMPAGGVGSSAAPAADSRSSLTHRLLVAPFHLASFLLGFLWAALVQSLAWAESTTAWCAGALTGGTEARRLAALLAGAVAGQRPGSWGSAAARSKGARLHAALASAAARRSPLLGGDSPGPLFSSPLSIRRRVPCSSLACWWGRPPPASSACGPSPRCCWRAGASGRVAGALQETRRHRRGQELRACVPAACLLLQPGLAGLQAALTALCTSTHSHAHPHAGGGPGRRLRPERGVRRGLTRPALTPGDGAQWRPCLPVSCALCLLRAAAWGTALVPASRLPHRPPSCSPPCLQFEPAHEAAAPTEQAPTAPAAAEVAGAADRAEAQLATEEEEAEEGQPAAAAAAGAKPAQFISSREEGGLLPPGCAAASPWLQRAAASAAPRCGPSPHLLCLQASAPRAPTCPRRQVGWGMGSRQGSSRAAGSLHGLPTISSPNLPRRASSPPKCAGGGRAQVFAPLSPGALLGWRCRGAARAPAAAALHACMRPPFQHSVPGPSRSSREARAHGGAAHLWRALRRCDCCFSCTAFGPALCCPARSGPAALPPRPLTSLACPRPPPPLCQAMRWSLGGLSCRGRRSRGELRCCSCRQLHRRPASHACAHAVAGRA